MDVALLTENVMNKPEITGGTWESDGVFITSSEQPKNVVAHVSNAHVSKEQKEANAQAISAVPELIDSGIKIIYCHENNMSITDSEIEILKQALLKAGCYE